jgi:hypothetical protein
VLLLLLLLLLLLGVAKSLALPRPACLVPAAVPGHGFMA